jgi:Fe-S-cluster containining protein
LVTDPDRVRVLAAAQETENLQFRRHLAAHHHHAIEPFQIIAERIERQFDCQQCANCCREMSVDVSRAEIEAVALSLNMSADDVQHRYTEVDPGNSSQRVLRSEKGACVFLDQNLCTIYDARPKACREFPHVHVGAHTLGARFESICLHSSVCPILFNALEEYKHVVGYHPARE